MHVKITQQWKSTLREKILARWPNRFLPMMLWETFQRQICISKLDWHIWIILFGFCTESLWNHNCHRCLRPSRTLQEPDTARNFYVRIRTNFFSCVNKIEALIVWRVARKRKSWGRAAFLACERALGTAATKNIEYLELIINGYSTWSNACQNSFDKP